MNLSLGKEIAVSTTYIKSNPAVPIYNGVESPENLYAVIYHIEIGYSEKKGRLVECLRVRNGCRGSPGERKCCTKNGPQFNSDLVVCCKSGG